MPYPARNIPESADYVRLECLPTCQGPGNPARYPPLSFGEYLEEVNRQNYDV